MPQYSVQPLVQQTWNDSIEPTQQEIPVVWDSIKPPGDIRDCNSSLNCSFDVQTISGVAAAQ